MARESLRQMNALSAPSEYVGALLPDEGRLVLMKVDEADPWESFRALRRTMRNRRATNAISLGLFESADPLEHNADVISMDSRRRAG